ncbi:MAG: hypothetical protein M1834_002745 [Cirrosporium novae-zelandiae]|nr:MAG: hypothetical protein M1834_002745 [Cirrosporium novae-zelandiae]
MALGAERALLKLAAKTPAKKRVSKGTKRQLEQQTANTAEAAGDLIQSYLTGSYQFLPTLRPQLTSPSTPATPFLRIKHWPPRNPPLLLKSVRSLLEKFTTAMIPDPINRSTTLSVNTPSDVLPSV